MPVVVREVGFTVSVYGPPREHPPAHVHVHQGKEGLVFIRLATPDAPPEVWRVYQVKYRDVLRALQIVKKHHDLIHQVWRLLHG